MFNPPDYIVPQKSYTQEEIEAAVLQEREACAKVCDYYFALNEDQNFANAAEAIRTRK